MPKRTAKSGPPLPVILLGTEGLELLYTSERGNSYARLQETVEPGAGAAQQIARFARANGLQPGPCVLALGSTVLSQRVVGLPEMPAKELESVLHRKAAALIDADPADTLFTALPLDPEEGAKERKWMLLAMRSRSYLALRYGLREAGFKVQSVVSERMSLASAAETVMDLAAEESCIAVGMEIGATGVHLLHGGRLVHQTVLTSRFEDDAAMAKVLVQELRGFDAFWRRRSRGGTINKVVLVGFAPRWAERLEFAVRAALPGAKTQRLVRQEQTSDGSRNARMVALGACRTKSGVQVSFDLPLAPRRTSIGAVAAASILAASAIAFVSFGEAEERRADLERERNQLALEAEGLEELERERERVRGLHAVLEQHRRRVETVGAYGLPLDETLRAVLEVTGTHGGVRSISVSANGDDARHLRIEGSIPAAPVLSQRAIDGMLENAAQSELLRGFQVATPKGGSSTARWIEFQADAYLGGQR